MRDPLSLIPFAKLFITIAIGTVLGRSVPMEISFVALLATMGVLLLYPFLKNYRVVISYVALFGLGLALPYLENEKSICCNENQTVQMVMTDTTIRREIIHCRLLDEDETILAIFDKKEIPSVGVGDTISATILPEDLRFAHFQLKRLAKNKPQTKLCAKVIALEWVHPLRGSYVEKRSFAKEVNDWCSERLKRLHIPQADLGIINGMLLGNREEIDKQRQEQYAETGIAHLLSISGMHIGIIFMILNLLFLNGRRTFYGRVITSILIILSLWAYTLMVGSPVSALRATAMFTILQISIIRVFSPLQIYNTLFATATLFVLIDSDVLYDVGFQLSFISILSILLFFPLFSRPFATLPKPLKYFMDSVMVSIAAQLLTTPLVAHYFGYFSVVSIVANIFGAVAIYVIMIVAISYILFPNPVSEWIILMVFNLLNAILDFLTSLPYSHIDNIPFSFTDVVIYYVILYFFYNWVVSSNNKDISSNKNTRY